VHHSNASSIEGSPVFVIRLQRETGATDEDLQLAPNATRDRSPPNDRAEQRAPLVASGALYLTRPLQRRVGQHHARPELRPARRTGITFDEQFPHVTVGLTPVDDRASQRCVDSVVL